MKVTLKCLNRTIDVSGQNNSRRMKKECLLNDPIRHVGTGSKRNILHTYIH